MRQILQAISNNFLNEKNNKYNKENDLIKYLNFNCKSSFDSTGVVDSEKYKVDYSAGKGAWATIPWIAIFDKDISITASKGYDIVYLFSADMSKVYLSLNQGWTYFKDKYKSKIGKEKIKTVVEIWQNLLKSNLGEFSYEPINLEYKGNTTELPLGYELGHICGKYYLLNDLPSEEVLRRDLQNMLSIFRELKGNMINLSVEDTNNYLLSENNKNIFNELKTENKIKTLMISDIIEKKGLGSVLIKSDLLPKSVEENNKKSNSRSKRSSKPTNYTEKTKNQEIIGKVGEYIVLEHERLKLKELDIKEDVEHVSVTQNDMAGYDIKSYDENGQEIYIEVKATQGNIEQPFFLTSNELNFLKNNQQNYFIYRLFNLNIENKTAEYYILSGDITEYMNVIPETYKVYGTK